MTDTELNNPLADKLVEVFGKNVFKESELTREFYVELKIRCTDFFQNEDGVFDSDLFWSEGFREWLMKEK